ncbi:VWA domain-containing protein, partial [Streptomyces sp. NPDC057424]|uniref:VWA domain-containing protein n=1 Tax=Streptomyces sp. NPDC057424 TaxID=3346127 RepID=UPI0036C035CD
PEAEAKPTADAKPKAESEPEPEPTPEAKPTADAKPTPEPEPEPTPEAEPTADAKPTPEAEAKPTADAKPKAESEAKPKPAPKAAASTKAKPETTSEAVAEADAVPAEEASAEAKPKPEPKAKPKAAPKATQAAEADAAPEPAAPAPAAADGDQAPQGPPAPDDESSTGGAGGKDTAEGEAEAGPALPLTRVKTHAPGLTTAYKAATTTLETNALTGTRAKVYLVLDRSASMRPYYKDGSAQALAEQTLALAAHLDPEATVPVVFFSTELDGTGEITLTDHENKIDDLHAGLGRMGRTSYHAAVEAVLAHHGKTAEPASPALVIFQTDGAPDAKTPATQALTDAAKTHPAVFFSFVAFGDPENKAFDYLRKLKTPNTSHFLAGETPRELTDKELYEGVLANWRP